MKKIVGMFFTSSSDFTTLDALDFIKKEKLYNIKNAYTLFERTTEKLTISNYIVDRFCDGGFSSYYDSIQVVRIKKNIYKLIECDHDFKRFTYFYIYRFENC